MVIGYWWRMLRDGDRMEEISGHKKIFKWILK